jgi:hypothetical protein
MVVCNRGCSLVPKVGREPTATLLLACPPEAAPGLRRSYSFARWHRTGVAYVDCNQAEGRKEDSHAS